MSMEQNIQRMGHFLRQFPLFRELTDDEMIPLVDLMKSRTFSTNSFVFMKDEPITNVYFILEGEVKIFRTSIEGKEQIVNILKAPDMFPHRGLFREDNYPANAQVMENSRLMYLSITDFEQFLIMYPHVSIKMFRILSEIIGDLQSRLEEKILFTVYEQIVMLLIRLTKNYGKQINEVEHKIGLQFTNQDLANMIGSSRETVSRTLTLLRRKKLIRNDDDGFCIVNYEELKEQFNI